LKKFSKDLNFEILLLIQLITNWTLGCTSHFEISHVIIPWMVAMHLGPITITNHNFTKHGSLKWKEGDKVIATVCNYVCTF